MEQSLFIELINRTKSTLESIKKVAQRSRGKFLDKGFEDFFYQAIMGDIENNDLLMECFLNYICVTSPTIKKDTVNTLIEEMLKRHRVPLEERQIKILKKYDKDLAETIVPDEQLRFILDSVLRFALASIAPYGSIEFLTRSLVFRGETGRNVTFFDKNDYIEILVTFEFVAPAPQTDTRLSLILRLVDVIVEKNQGKMEFKDHITRTKKIVSLKLPHERRKVVYYTNN
jgi:hypothetical protein